MPVGIGYDIHRLVEGRPLVLGGITIPADRGLLGHSDADVLTHAIIDAILGAACLGDIGQHFPDNDSRYAGLYSLDLLVAASRLITKKGYMVHNIDATVIAQQPKLAPYIESMRQSLAHALELEQRQVSVKATTNEGLGSLGRGEGIAALAVCQLEEER